MAVSVALLTSTASTSNTATHLSASYTPSANAILYLFAFIDGFGGSDPTISIDDYSWTLEDEGAYNSAIDKYWLFSALSGASPSAGQTQVNLSVGATGINFAIVEVTGANLSASPRVLQSVFNNNSNVSSTNPTGTFASALKIDNAYIAGFGINRAAPAATPPSDWTEIVDDGHIVPVNGAALAYRVGNETRQTLAFTAATGTWGFVGIEVDAVRITTQPFEQTAAVGATAQFSVAGDGLTAYQWQDNSGGSFANIGGATASSYTTAATTLSFDGRRYRVVLNGGLLTSVEAQLIVPARVGSLGQFDPHMRPDAWF